MARYYDKEGEPISLLTWGQLFEFLRYRVVAQTNVGNLMVSTVWLGLDHDLWGHGPPLIFETMIFDSDDLGHELDQQMRRYSTLEQAIAGHAEMVARAEQP